ncbi:helix-turn-helix transcriptional regulator [Nonomuraea wenchangensis]
MQATRYGARTQYVGPREAFWAHRAVTHEVRAADRRSVHRIRLRKVPGLAEWAERLHVSVKTLQRDFEREFGMPYSKVRTKLRLSTSRVLLETRPVAEVAHRVGYSSPSAFISAFTKEYGCTPGRYADRRPAANA